MTARAPLFDRLGARLPVIQAPMAGAGGVALARAAIAGGGVGSLPCAMIDAAAIVDQARTVGDGPLNLNFFCHAAPPDDADDAAWRAVLAQFHTDEAVEAVPPPPPRRPFDEAAAMAVERVRPAMVSFHFGLPDAALLDRVRATGAVVVGNATSVAEAAWLAARGCDAIIAQGYEAGGHAGWFLDGHRPVGTMALVPQVVDAIADPGRVPVIAAGGIADARGAGAAIMLGAAGVQVGSAYLATRQAMPSAPLAALIGTPASGDSVFTTLFSGRAARGIRNRLIETLGPTHVAVPPFPLASAALAPLRAAAEAAGRGDNSPLWAGQAAPLARETDARRLTETLGQAALAAWERLHAA